MITAKSRPWFGLATTNGYYPAGQSEMASFETDTGFHVEICLSFFDMSATLWNPTYQQQMKARGTLCMPTYQPPVSGGLAEIIAGNYDAAMTTSFAAMKNIPHILRIMQEMNLPPGANGTYGQQPTDFITAWNHVRAVKIAAGNTAPMFWCPNVTGGAGGLAAMAQYYPGDSQCEYVGLDGYSTITAGGQSFQTIFDSDLNTLEALSPHPIIIGETGVQTGITTPRQQWLTGMFQYLKTRPRVVGVNYWNRDVDILSGSLTAGAAGSGMREWRRSRMGLTLQ